MLLAFIMVIVIIGFGILLGIYSIFFPFFENLNDITNYNIAYYGAISSIERGLLITKYQEPGFEGSGGWLYTSEIGPQSDQRTDNLGRLERESNSMYRTITSETTQIPKPGKGNINYLLATTGSENYNELGYHQIESFLLNNDETNDPELFYQNDGDISFFNGSYIEGVFRLPPKVFDKFGGTLNGLLCDDEGDPNCDLDQDGVYDEIAIDRNIEGKYSNINFQIIPYSHVFYNQTPSLVDELYDTNIRENTINYTMENLGYPINIEFSDTLNNDYNPVITNSLSQVSGHNVISQNEDSIKFLNFRQLFQNSEEVTIDFGLAKLLQNSDLNIYPFLEYQFTFAEAVADRFFHIQGIGQVGDYKVEIIFQKPTSEKQIASDFTIIF